jgi:Zn-dependent peptidase ImmA (M78 family)
MTAETNARTAAERLRTAHRLGWQPLGDLAALIEQTSRFHVAVLESDGEDRGLSLRDPHREVVVIGVAQSRHPLEQRSTLAHELGRAIVGDFSGGPAEGSQFAEAFARHLLVPVQGVADMLGRRENVTEAELSAVVQRFLVPPAMAARALRDAGYIDDARAAEWMRWSLPSLAVRSGWSDHYEGLADESNRCRAPQKLLTAAQRAYGEGRISAQAVAVLRGIPADQVEAELTAVGIVPPPALVKPGG